MYKMYLVVYISNQVLSLQKHGEDHHTIFILVVSFILYVSYDSDLALLLLLHSYFAHQWSTSLERLCAP
jgi:hypothetical protein